MRQKDKFFVMIAIFYELWVVLRRWQNSSGGDLYKIGIVSEMLGRPNSVKSETVMKMLI